MINGVTELTMMKADVLSHFDEIKVCVGYMVQIYNAILVFCG